MGIYLRTSLRAIICVHLLIIIAIGSSQNEQDNHRSSLYEPNGTCSLDDLNHSLLVECRAVQCPNLNSGSIWPTNDRTVIHMYSTRNGERFAIDHLANLNYRESDIQRAFDINTTLYVTTSSTKQEIHGFGTTLDTFKFINHREGNSLVKSYSPILKDLYAKDEFGIRLSLLRVPLTSDVLKHHDISQVLRRVDDLVTKTLKVDNGPGRLRVILSLDDLEKSLDTIQILKTISESFSELQSIERWAIAISQESIENGMLGYIQELFSTKNILGIATYSKAVNLLDHLMVSDQSFVGGLLIKSEFSSPYSILDHMRALKAELSLLSISSDKPAIREYGDWQNAQNYAVEILNHLQHGSNGFLEESSVSDVLAEPYSEDRSIYSIQQDNLLHLRGPMLYAIGHFSRHVSPGSHRLGIRVDTQPNMFAAHYIAFLTPNNHVVAVVLNDNEHLLPFRLAIDGIIVTHINLKPKSFNTIVIKQ